MIKVSNLNKYYNKGKSNEIHVINNASLEIANTGLVAFLGKSGSGKTTLLNVIGGLDRAKGKIEYEDVEIKNYKVSKIDKYREENIGYIFQNYSLIHNLTVLENLRVSLSLIGINDEEAVDERIDCALKSVGMYKYRKRLAGTLSGGQQQRIAIARALIKNAKIIIADEPTGNLDSQNTIEVLNILKQIAKTRLVLLVTHDVKLAEFYADRIIEIKDGLITNDYSNENHIDEYSHNDNVSIYLGDLEKEETSSSNINITKYSDQEMPNLDLKIVYSNGTVYIESPLKIKLIGANTPVRLIDGKFEKMTTEDIKTDYNFDFKKIQKKRRNAKSFFKRFWQAIVSFFSAKRRTYLLYFAFIITGMLMALCAYNIGKYTTVSTDDLIYDENAYIIADEKNYNDVDDDLVNLLYDENSGIENIVLPSDSIESNYYSIKTNTSEGYLSVRRSSLRYLLEPSLKDKLIKGTYPTNENDVLIDKIIAERLIADFENVGFIIEEDDLLNVRCNMYNGKIAGIVDTKSTAIYSSYSGNRSNGTRLKEYDCYEDALPDIKIVNGVGIAKSGECIVPVNTYNVGNNLDFYSLSLKIVGEYISTENDKILVTKDTYASMVSAIVDNGETFVVNQKETKLVEGVFPKEKNEVIIPSIITSVALGEGINVLGKEYKVVGKYDLDYSKNVCFIGISIKQEIVRNSYLDSSEIYIYTNDASKTKAFVEGKGYSFEKAYDYNVSNIKEVNVSFSDIFFIIFLLVETVLFVYFMMRAKMINKIKDIGIYRALGARKRTIIKDFLIELLVLTTLTTLLGYIVGSYMIVSTLKAFNSIADIFVINMKVIVLCGIGTYLINVIFGLLPIFTLLRKTPSEIMAKYDI